MYSTELNQFDPGFNQIITDCAKTRIESGLKNIDALASEKNDLMLYESVLRLTVSDKSEEIVRLRFNTLVLDKQIKILEQHVED